MASPRKNVPSMKTEMAKRMSGSAFEKMKRPTQARGLHPRVSELHGKADRKNYPRAEASAQMHKRFEKFNSNSSYGAHGKVAAGWENNQ